MTNILTSFATRLKALASSPSRTSLASFIQGWSNTGFTTPTNYNELMRHYTGWVYACVNKNANAQARSKLRLYRKTAVKDKPAAKINGRYVTAKTYRAWEANKRIASYITKSAQIEEVEEHKLLDLLASVNPFMNGFELINLTAISNEMVGNSYWYLVPSKLKGADGFPLPAEIWFLPAQNMTIIQSDDPAVFIDGYKMTIGANTQEYTTDEVIHFRFPNPNNPYYGVGPLSAAAYAVEIDLAQHKYVYNLMRNFAIPPVVFTLPYDMKTGKGPEWDQTKVNAWREQWNQVHGGANIGKAALLQGGLDIKPLGFAPKDIAYLVEQKPTLDELSAIFGVPRFLLIGESTDKNNAAGSMEMYNRDTILPRLTLLEQKLNEQLVPRYDPNLFLAFEPIAPEDEQLELEELKSLTNTVITANEARSRKGLEPKEGGDELYIDSGKVAINATPQMAQQQQIKRIVEQVVLSKINKKRS